MKKNKPDISSMKKQAGAKPKKSPVTKASGEFFIFFKSDEYILKFIKKIESFLVNELCLNSEETIVLAVSGGVDSIVMADVFAYLKRKYNFKLIIAHFNHKLRAVSSDEDEEFVKIFSAKNKIPFETGSGNVKKFAEKNSMSTEQAARELRYKFYERISKISDARLVATAHTADDLAETFLINLLRGSGLTGLSGIPAKRQLIKNVLMVRPLLCVTKTEIIEYANRRGLKWHEDETNNLSLYLRNKIRNDLMPKIITEFSPSMVEILNRTARLMQGADRFISEQIKNIINEITTDKTSDRFSIKIPVLQTLDEFVQGEVLQLAITSKYHIQPLPLQTIDRIMNLIKSPVGSTIEINKNLVALRDREIIIISSRISIPSFKISIKKSGEFRVGNVKIVLKEVQKNDLKFNANPNVEYFDADLIPNILYLRSREEGDIFNPLGMSGSMSVSDFLTNNKISLLDKQKIILLTTKSEILWICGMRINDKFKITDDTTKVIKAEMLR
ncbi:MAG: tRNA lysidine(34) synthetase TilS [Bacteroidota bacterium]